MTDAERLAQLEAAVEALSKRLDPQTLRDALERTWDPRGGEPRIMDSSGRTLDYAPTVQFVGATTELDAPNQRVVVTASGGGGGALEGEFSQDATTSDAERLKFYDPGNPSVNQLQLDTLTVGTTRAATMVVAEDVGAGPTNYGALALQGDDTTLGGLGAGSLLAAADAFASATVQASAAGSADSGLTCNSNTGGASVAASATSSDNGAVSATLESATQDGGAGTADATTYVQAGAEDGDATILLSATSSSGSASLTVKSEGAGLAHEVLATAGARSVRVMDEVDVSSFMQVSDDSTNSTPRQRWTRGPFRASPGALAAGATASVVVNSVSGASATWRVVTGHIEGAAGVEKVLWSMDPSTVTPNVSISFTNTDSGSQTAELVFVVIADD